MARTGPWCVFALMTLAVSNAWPAAAATVYVAAGSDLQAALDAAQPGDTILLEEGAEFVGNFVLPVKTGDRWITVRTAAPDSVLPGPGVRIHPSHAPLLARLRSDNSSAALRTDPGAHHWDIRYLEFGANRLGYGDVIQIGDGSSAQNTLDKVPHHFVLNHIYLHGDPAYGQKRGISLNAAHVTITDSFIAECKGVGLDTQAIAGWNGPGPYVIENNYLEGAGENIMFGGADPAIAGMVADGVTFRRNYLSRPMAWKDPIFRTPQGVAAAAVPGGSLTAGIYGYRVVARGAVGGGVTGRSTASAEVSAEVVVNGGAVRVSWQPVAGASEYRVYGRIAAAQSTYWTTTDTQFVDTGAAGTAENVPTTTGTVWSVKNLFELKNARNVVVEHNVLENHWKEAQPGYSIVLTPRNSGGACTWCGVENVRIEYNLIRNVAAGINMIGYDSPTRPTRQTNGIVIRHNLFQKMTTTLGGNGWFMLIGGGPRDITVEHNTVETDGNTAVSVYGGTSTDPTEVYGFVMTANALRHGTYGINGSYFTYGNAILAAYYPDAIFGANYLAGGSASRYPAGNYFAGLFADQFVDPSNGDFTVRGDSLLKSAAPDGSDVGVDFAQLKAKLEGVEAGVPPFVPGTAPVAAFTSACTFLACTFTDASAPGTAPIAAVSWAYGDGLSGGEAQHTYASSGTYSVTLTVTDSNGLSSQASSAVTVEAPNAAPTAAFATVCSDLACTFSCTSTDTDGTIASRTWRFSDGSTAAGASVTRAFPSPGSYGVTLSVADDDGAAAETSATVTVKALLHIGDIDAVRKTWNRYGSPFWSASMTIVAHGGNERLVPNAVVQYAFSGAVVKTGSCVTNTNGACTVDTGTLSWKRDTVTLTIVSVSAPDSTYGAQNHDADGDSNGTAISVRKNN